MACQLTVRRGDEEGKHVYIYKFEIQHTLALIYYIVHVRCTWQASSHTYCRLVEIIFEGINLVDPSSSSSRPTPNLSRPNGPIADCDFTSVVVVAQEVEFEVTPDAVGSAAAFNFVVGALFDVHSSSTSGSSSRLAGLILPPAGTAGYCIRSDIIPLRFVDCDILEPAVSFATPQQYFKGDAIKDDASIVDIFAMASGGFLVRADAMIQDPQSLFLSLRDELSNRLSFPWVTERKVSHHQTLAIVEGGRTKPGHGGVADLIYPAAKALDIKMVVLDCSGHWLEDARYEDWRMAFLPIDLEAADLAQRIIAALAHYGKPVDGIVTFCDSYQAAVAVAAGELLLPTCPPFGYEIATNKYATSVFEGRNSYRGFSMDDAHTIAAEETLNFPLIVKPCKGWGSEGVRRVTTRAELIDAVQFIDSARHGSEFLIEEYCDGPEVDVNMVLYDGVLLFHEVSDDCPKSAESNTGSSNDNAGLHTFIEMDSVHPSALPENERGMLRDAFHHSLRRLGLTHGVFHIEGRIQNSSMEFRVNGTQIQDLAVRRSDGGDRSSTSDHLNPPPSAWLLDLNPRPPGMTASLAPGTTYGIDYYALSLLIALRDTERVHALSQPFQRGPQYWCVMVYIPTDFPVERKGVFDSGDICAELKQRRPDLAAQISNCLCFVERGQVLPHPNSGVNTWVAYFNVYSRTSRRHALELAHAVRQETRFEFL